MISMQFCGVFGGLVVFVFSPYIYAKNSVSYIYVSARVKNTRKKIFEKSC